MKMNNQEQNQVAMYLYNIINLGKYKLVMFAMAKLMEMETTEQNKVALYLYNNISME